MSKINDLFVGWFDYSNEEYEEIVNKGFISLDTNVLLNLFRYSKDNSRETLNLLKSIKDRLIFPYYTVFEFVKNRKKVASDSIEEYKKMISSLDDKYNALLNELNSISSNKVSSKDKLINSIQKNKKSIIESLEAEKNKKEELFKNGLEAEICELIDTSILDEYKDDEFENMKKEGIRRFKEQIPPGYLDADKKENGDYYIFKSLVDFSKQRKSDMIFVTDDTKADMFVNLHGIKYARPELLNEFHSLTGQKLLIFTLQEFLNNKVIFKNDVSEALLDEIKSISLENQKISYKMHNRIRKFLYKALKYKNCNDLKSNVDEVQKSLRTAMRISQGCSGTEVINNYDLLIDLLNNGEYQKFIDLSQPERDKIFNLKNRELERIQTLYMLVQNENGRLENIQFMENLLFYVDEYFNDSDNSKEFLVHLRRLRDSYIHGYIDDNRFSEELDKAYNYINEGE